MPKQLNVNMSFTADTSQAKRQLQDLQRQLSNLTSNSLSNSNGFGLTKEIEKATVAASKLQVQLSEATNPQTGVLDLGKFTESMKRSGMDLQQYKEQLVQLGPEGKQAFLSLAESISNAEVPLLRANSLLKQMGTTIANAARWQISSSIIHGFMGAVQGAYGYAQDLNASLNSIRIVSGQTTEQMAKFADQANRAAQSLSTSTLAYTDAALIFYQQGLRGEAVTERVDTVLKLSNVTGDSAEQVSSYMTAIWNNFYDGSQSLESFADKITALGAATASSSAEIAAGLQQFAAIGNTVGLSYDYAATALATIVAQTRQSESTVGNGLRTIFARLSSLKQGGTDEDGVDLTKYTKALNEVGISVLDQNGNLKEMDEILNDIGAKWETLSKNQQVALAQTVGGVRQYATLIALFDNWDQFQKNLDVTLNADGTLQEQADIYAQSWEAAQKRVKTAWQAIYQDLINDKFFITILNGIADILKGIDHIIDAAGGLGGVLSGLVFYITSAFGESVAAKIDRIGMRLSSLTASGRQFIEDQRTLASNLANDIQFDMSTDQGIATNLVNEQVKLAQDKLLENAKRLNEEDIKHYQNSINILKINGEQVIKKGEELDLLKQQTEELALQAQRKIGSDKWGTGDTYSTYTQTLKETGVKKEIYNQMSSALSGIEEDKIQDAIANIKKAWQSLKDDDTFTVLAGKAIDDIDDVIEKLESSKGSAKELTDIINEASEQATAQHVIDFEKFSEDTGLDKDSDLAEKIADTNVKVGAESVKFLTTAQNFKSGSETIQNSFEMLGTKVSANAQKIVSAAQGISQLTFGINSIVAGVKALSDKDLGPWEKLSRVFISFSMGSTQLIGGLKKIGPLLFNTGKATTAFAAATANGGTKLVALKAAITGGITSFGLYAIAIAGVVAAGYALYNVLNKEEIAAKKAHKALEEAKTSWDEANSNFNNLYNSITDYQNAAEALSKLKENTAEWNKEVFNLNNQVLNLLEQFPILAQYLTSVNGVLGITEEGIHAVINSQWTETLQKQLEYRNQNLKVNESDAAVVYKNNAKENGFNRDLLQTAVKIWQESPGFFNKDANLEDIVARVNQETDSDGAHWNIDESTAQALIDNVAVIAKTSNEVSTLYKEQDAFDKNLASTVVGNELKEYLAPLSNEDQGLYKDYFSDRLQQEISSREQAGESITDIEQYSQILREIVEQESSNLEQLKNNVTDNALSNVTESIIAGKNLTNPEEIAKLTEEVREYYNNLPERDKTVFLNIRPDTDNLDEALEEAKQKIRDNIEDERSSLDTDVDEEEWETLTNYVNKNAEEINKNAEAWNRLSEQLLTNKSASAEVAEAILRFDDAIQDVSENYEDWMAKLSSGAQDLAEVGPLLQDAYGDLMDFDGSVLSASFIENKKNLEDMKLAIEGDEEAYKRLQAATREDIVSHLTLIDDDFYQKLNDVEAAMANMNFQDMEIGANLDIGDFLNQLEYMVNAAHMTKEQAEAYLASMGINAHIVQHTVEGTEETETAGFTPVITPRGEEYDGELMAHTIVGDEAVPVPLPVRVPDVDYKPKKEKVVTSKEATGFTLEVTGAEKASGGGFKFSQAKHGAGSQGANKPSSGKSGGGSKGSSPKKRTVKEHKKPEKKEDRYHDIKERIADLNTELKRLEKTESRVYGKAKLKYMDQEIEKLEKQIELTDEYIDEIKKYAAEDQARLRGIGMGATFDDTGRLNNYEQVLANIVASYNSAVATYNGAVDTFNASAQEDADNARLEAADKALAAAKETYDERLKILDQYEDTFNLLQEKWDERIDQVWQLFDKRLEQITWRIEFELDWNEKELTQFDWLLKYIGKDADHAADAIANLAKQMGVYEESLNWAKEGISEIFGLHGIDFDFDNADPQQLYDQLAQFMQMQNLESQLTEGEADALLQYMEAMRDAYDGMYDSWIEAHDKMMNAFDEWNDRLQEGLNDIAQYGQELEGIQKIVELTGRKMLKMTTQDMNRMSQAIVTNAQEYLRAATARRDALEPEVLAAEAHLQELIAGGASEEAINLARDEYRHMMEAWNEATNDWYSAFADALQAGQDAFETFIEQSTQDYKEGFGSMDLDYMQEQFERQKKVRDLYLDDYQKYHELNNTAKELNKSLASTNSELIRGKMLDLQDEMNAAMQSGVQISEAQAEIYARRVALLQAEAELLDAQNVKSAVRMTRDNEGNFSYTYTADQEQIGEAQNNYGDKFYELLQYERDYADQIQSEMLDSFQEFIDRRNEIAETYKDDQDAYVQAMEDLNEEYLAYVDYYVGELDMDFYEMGRLRDDDWLDFENITGLKLAEHDDFISHFTDTILGDLTNDYTTAGALATQWQHLMEESCQAATTAVNTYQSNTETTYNKAGENIETYGLKVNTKFDEMANKSANTADAVEDMGQDMVNTMAGIQSEAYQLDNTWAYVMDSMRNQIANTINALYSLMQKLDETTAHAQATIAAVQAAAAVAAANGYPANYGGDYGGGGSGGGGGSSNGPGGGRKTTGGKDTQWTDGVLKTGTGRGGVSFVDDPYGAAGTWGLRGSNGYIMIGSDSDPLVNKTRKIISAIASGASGMYTGEWGTNGKLAILHEKELVLNKEDTANMLTAVGVVRSMMDSIAGNGMMNSLALAAGGVSGSFGSMLDQNVHIEANFPNVQSHTEIEMAINNLINSASQYVNRKS